MLRVGRSTAEMVLSRLLAEECRPNRILSEFGEFWVSALGLARFSRRLTLTACLYAIAGYSTGQHQFEGSKDEDPSWNYILTSAG